MQTAKATNQALEEQIKEINEVLEVLKNNQIKELILLQKNHSINMKKIDKLQEFNKISDMTNQLFEKRLSGIENAIVKLNNSISAKI